MLRKQAGRPGARLFAQTLNLHLLESSRSHLLGLDPAGRDSGCTTLRAEDRGEEKEVNGREVYVGEGEL